jgi:hypothetical protein
VVEVVVEEQMEVVEVVLIQDGEQEVVVAVEHEDST